MDRPGVEQAPPSRGAAALAGAVASAVSLAVGELLAGLLPGTPPLVASVGAAVIDVVPRPVKDLAIALVGVNDKVALNIGVTTIAIAIGALLGIAGVRRRAVPVVGFWVFGALGYVAALDEPLASPLLSLIAVALAVTLGLFVLRGLLRAATPERTLPGWEPDQDAQRRRFLRLVVGVGAAAAIGAVMGRVLANLRLATGRETVALPAPVAALPTPSAAAELAIPGLTPIVVPNHDFYRIDTRLTVPHVDVDGWRLRIHGMVEREVSLTFEDLVAMPLDEHYVTIACVSNEVGGRLVGNARWTGVALRDLLDMAGVDPQATQIVGRSTDGWTAGFPTEAAYDGRTALLAVGMNDEPLPLEHGFPARLIVAGLYGYVSATKWITELELTTLDGFDAYWVPRGWAKEAPVKTSSRIDVPRSGDQVAAGTVAVAGVAWAPDTGIAGVEVAIDEGAWQPARLSEPLSDDAWRQWVFEWDAQPGSHSVAVRATDAGGTTQPEDRTPPFPDGAEGHHVIRVRVA